MGGGGGGGGGKWLAYNKLRGSVDMFSRRFLKISKSGIIFGSFQTTFKAHFSKPSKTLAIYSSVT